MIEMRSRQFSGREVVRFVPGVRTALNSIRIPDASNIFVVLCCTEPSGISRVLTFYLIRNAIFLSPELMALSRPTLHARNPCARPADARHDGTQGDSRNVCDLPVRKLFQLPEYQDLAVFRGQFRQGLLHEFASLCPQPRGLRVGSLPAGAV